MSEATCLIPLHDHKKKLVGHAVIDEIDYELLSQWCWHLSCGGYVVHATRNPRILWRMHRVIMDVTDPTIQVDHKNFNRSDNRRSNLCIATNAQNSQNRRPQRNNKSGYRGVRFARGRWEAHARLNGKFYYLGRYNTPEDASEVAAAFRAEHMPFSSDARERACV